MSILTKQQSRLFAWSLHLAGAVTVTLFVGGFNAFIFQPIRLNQESHISRTEQLDMLLLKAGADGNVYRKLRNQLEEMKESVSELHRQLSNHPTKSETIDSLTGIASNVGLVVLDHSLGSTKSQQTYSQTEVEFRCHGSYASICNFLQQVEQLTKTTKLSKFELDVDENSHGYPIQLTFVLYSEGHSHDTKEKRGVL